MFFIEVICQVFKHFWIFLLDGTENIGFEKMVWNHRWNMLDIFIGWFSLEIQLGHLKCITGGDFLTSKYIQFFPPS